MIKKAKLSIKPQSTIETCLSMCLIALLENNGIRVLKNEEINILVQGIKFTKFDYSTGHLVYVCKKYPVTIEQYVEHPLFYQFLSKYSYPKNMELINKKINEKLINEMKYRLPFIIYIDQFYFGGLHLPHFVILEKMDKTTATILDPWNGTRKKTSIKILFKSIKSLRNKLKISPKLIVLGSLDA